MTAPDATKSPRKRRRAPTGGGKPSRISVTLDAESRERIERLSQARRETMSGICSRIIEKYLYNIKTEDSLNFDLFGG